MSCSTQDFEIVRGSTFIATVRWEVEPIVYKAITAITAAAPPVITAAGHALTDGWSAAIVSALGMRQINAKHWPLRKTDFHKATVVSATQVSFNDINAAEYDAYTSGGYLVYNTPADLTGFTARMQIKDTFGGTEIIELETDPAPGGAAGNARIALDNTAKTITLTLTAALTAAIDDYNGVYDLEMVDADGVVTKILQGSVTFADEATT